LRCARASCSTLEIAGHRNFFINSRSSMQIWGMLVTRRLLFFARNCNSRRRLRKWCTAGIINETRLKSHIHPRIILVSSRRPSAFSLCLAAMSYWGIGSMVACRLAHVSIARRGACSDLFLLSVPGPLGPMRHCVELRLRGHRWFLILLPIHRGTALLQR